MAAKQSRPAATKRSTREARLTEAAQVRGWKLEKVGEKFKLVASNETIVADDWSTGEGLDLDAIEQALANE